MCNVFDLSFKLCGQLQIREPDRKYITPPAAASKSASCETVTVSGGASPGTYVNSGLVFEGKEAWIQTVGGEVVAVLRYMDGILRRRRQRRRLDGGT